MQRVTRAVRSPYFAATGPTTRSGTKRSAGATSASGGSDDKGKSKASSKPPAKRSRSHVKLEMDEEPKRKTPRENFETTWALLSAARAKIIAPVDSMGCHALGDKNASAEDFRFQTLCALILSSQTKDVTTAAAMQNFNAWGCTVEHVANASHAVIDGLISKVGFHKSKAQWIIDAAKVCRDQYNGDIPSTMEQLMELKGVGPKMANLTMQICWGVSDGIAVDVHVHRISNRLGWVKTTSASNGPEATRKALQDWLPRDKWVVINPLLVGWGQAVCSARAPKCDECPLASLCPSAPRSVKNAVRGKDPWELIPDEVREAGFPTGLHAQSFGFVPAPADAARFEAARQAEIDAARAQINGDLRPEDFEEEGEGVVKTEDGVKVEEADVKTEVVKTET